MVGRKWTDDEIAWVDEHRDRYTTEKMARILKRSVNSVRDMMTIHGMVGVRKASPDLSINQICKMMGVPYRKVKKWQAAGLELKPRYGALTVTQKDFADFLKAHPDLWDPECVKDDTLLCYHFGVSHLDKRETFRKRKPWTTLEINRLKMFHGKGLSAPKIAKQLDRTPTSVRSMIHKLQCKGELKCNGKTDKRRTGAKREVQELDKEDEPDLPQR